jgi:hypothetical protein
VKAQGGVGGSPEREQGTDGERRERVRETAGFIEEEWGAKNRLEQPGTFAVGAGVTGSFQERHREAQTPHVSAGYCLPLATDRRALDRTA